MRKTYPFGIGKEKEVYRAIEKRKLLLPDLSYECRVKNFFNLRERPDYLFSDMVTGRHVFLEVKPWEVRIKDMEQLLRYLVHIEEEGDGDYDLALLCFTIKENRRKILEQLGIRVFTFEDCIFSSHDLEYWF